MIRRLKLLLTERQAVRTTFSPWPGMGNWRTGISWIILTSTKAERLYLKWAENRIKLGVSRKNQDRIRWVGNKGQTKKREPKTTLFLLSSGSRTRTYDLWVMLTTTTFVAYTNCIICGLDFLFILVLNVRMFAIKSLHLSRIFGTWLGITILKASPNLTKFT